MADEIRNDNIQEENRMEEKFERPDPDHSYSTYPETSGRYPYGESTSPAVVEDTDDGIGAAEVAVAGAAVVGVGAIGYGIYRGIKWIFEKVMGVDEDDDDEDEEDEKPRRSKKKKQGKKKVTKKKTSRKKAKEPDPDDEEDFEEEDEESESEE